MWNLSFWRIGKRISSTAIVSNAIHLLTRAVFPSLPGDGCVCVRVHVFKIWPFRAHTGLRCTKCRLKSQSVTSHRLVLFVYGSIGETYGSTSLQQSTEKCLEVYVVYQRTYERIIISATIAIKLGVLKLPKAISLITTLGFVVCVCSFESFSCWQNH